MAVVALSGCRLDVAADVEIGGDGRGRAVVEFELDGAMVAELDALEVDPTAELEAAGAAGQEWQVERARGDGGSLQLRLERTVADAAELGEVLRELSAGLGPGDPALRLDLDVSTGPDGQARLDGTAALDPPAGVGATVEGSELGPAGEELAALVTEAVSARLTATLPGELVEHDADAVDGRTVTWGLEVGEEREVRAVSAPAPWWRALPAWVGQAAAAAVLLALVAVLIYRARRRRSSAEPVG